MKKKYSLLSLSLLLLIFGSNNIFSQWTSNTSLNSPICIATGAQRDPKIESDDMGGAFIVWKDYRTGIPDIYVQHVDSNGVPTWTIDGLGVCIQSADQSTPSMISDGAGGIIVTWSDWRSGIERDIYAQRIDANGNILWTPDGAPVTIQVEREHNEKIVTDGAGGCIITYEKQNNSTFLWDIWAQKLNASGAPMWGPGGVAMVTASSNKRNPKIQKDQTGGAYITWQDLRNGFEYDIYAQHMSSAGARLWTDNGLAVCAATNDQTNPKIDPDVINGGVYVAWADQRNGIDNDIYCQLIDSTGIPLWIANGVAVSAVANSQAAVDILSNSNVSGVILTWKDERSGNTDIYAQRLSITGAPQWTANGIQVQANSFPQLNPNIAGDGLGGAVICWQDSFAITQWDIKAQRIDAAGAKLWNTNGVVVSSATAMQSGPKNTSDDDGGTIVVWEDYRTGTRDIYAQRIYSNGTSIGIDEESNITGLTVFPNPFVDQFEVEFTQLVADDYSMMMTNILGEDVTGFIELNTSLQNNQNKIIVGGEQLNPGIYFLTINFANSGAKTIKMIKK